MVLRWHMQNNSSLLVFFFKKKLFLIFSLKLLIIDGSGQRGVDKGVWDSIHVMEVVPDEGSQTASYKLTTTIILTLTTKFLDLSGSVQKQSQKSKKFDKVNTHIVNMGNMIQEMENQLRDQLQTVYFDKAREITRTLRNPMPKGTRNLQKNMADELANALANKRR